MNVLEDPAGFADLQKLGLRTVPVLARGDKFIFGQNTQQIIDQCYAGNAQTCAALTFAPDRTITLITLRPFNLVNQIARGIDFEASYRTPLDAINDSWSGNLTLRAVANKTLNDAINTGTITIDRAYVEKHIGDLARNTDLSKFIL